MRHKTRAINECISTDNFSQFFYMHYFIFIRVSRKNNKQCQYLKGKLVQNYKTELTLQGQSQEKKRGEGIEDLGPIGCKQNIEC